MKREVAVEYFGYSLNEIIERIDEFNLYSDIHYEAFGRDINRNASGGFTSKGYIEKAN
jgi:hypothetical protein